MREKSRKSLGVTEWCRCEKYEVMDTNLECLSCGGMEALGYILISDMRHDDRNAVTERVNITVLQLYIIWTGAQILERVCITVLQLYIIWTGAQILERVSTTVLQLYIIWTAAQILEHVTKRI